MTRGEEVTVRAPAKINLQLSVGAPRSDGYHDLATVFQAVSVYDELTASRGRGVSVEVTGDTAAGVPVDDRNLAVRAATLLAARAGVAADVRLRLRKAIPLAGGMAGGSADAAAALVACDQLWGTELAREDLLDLAAELGSDVPFALVGGTAVGLGRGEKLTPALVRGRFEWVFAVAADGLSTPAVYAEADRLRHGRVLAEPRPSERIMKALRANDVVGLGAALDNDLEPAACSLVPRLHETLQVGRDNDVLGAVVSGSGPTCAFLVRDPEHGLDLAVALTASGACSTTSRAHGPVPGARVVEGPGD